MNAVSPNHDGGEATRTLPSSTIRAAPASRATRSDWPGWSRVGEEKSMDFMTDLGAGWVLKS
jgi:hypothetical protein